MSDAKATPLERAIAQEQVHVNVVDHPAQDRVPAVGEAPFESELHELLARENR